MNLSRLTIRFAIFLAACAFPAFVAVRAEDATGDQFPSTIQPILARHCFKCHGGESVEGDVNFKQIQTSQQLDANFKLFEKAASLIAAGDMPPADEPQLTAADRRIFAAWYNRRFVESVKAHPGFFKPRRLSAHEYRNTLHSLLGFPLEVAIREAEQTVAEKSLVMKLLPADPPGASGFKNDTSGNPLTSTLWNQQAYLAGNALAKLFSPSHRTHLEAYTGPIEGTHLSPAQAATMLRKFTTRAYRRPAPSALLEASLKAIDGKTGAALEKTLRSELKVVLMSPRFMYRGLMMSATAQGETARVDDYELAERLSYFLWADMPDAELMQLAGRQKLHESGVLQRQIDRMLRSPKSRSLAEELGVEWFSLNEIDHVSNNPPVADALKTQPVDFLHYVFTSRQPLTELIDSRVTFINPHTAGHYPRDRRQMKPYRKQRGIEVERVPNQKIELKETPGRGGLLTMPGVLAMNRGPVIRGVWLLERVLGEHLPEPPANVGQVKPNQPGEKLTFRQRFAQHRANKSCAVCHDKIDPLGFALQHYAGNGSYNANAAKNGIDASGKLPTGESFKDFAGLRQILVTSQRKVIVRNIVRRMLAYALARKLELHDRPTVEKLVDTLYENGTYRDLIYAIATSLPFQNTVMR